MFTNDDLAKAIETVADESFDAGKAVTNAKWFTMLAIGCLGYWYYKKIYVPKHEENKEEEVI